MDSEKPRKLDIPGEKKRVDATTDEEFEKFKAEEKFKNLLAVAFSGFRNPGMKEIYDTLFKTFIKSARDVLERLKLDIGYRNGNVDDPTLDESFVGPLAQTDLLALRMIENRVNDLEGYLSEPDANPRLIAGYFFNVVKGLDSIGAGKTVASDVTEAILPMCNKLKSNPSVKDIDEALDGLYRLFRM